MSKKTAENAQNTLETTNTANFDVKNHETTVYHELEIDFNGQEYSVKYCIDDMLYGEVYDHDNGDYLDTDSALYDAIMHATIDFVLKKDLLS